LAPGAERDDTKVLSSRGSFPTSGICSPSSEMGMTPKF
jgi:hypothetical protein